MVLYFAIMWSGAFAFTYYLSRYKSSHFGYEMAVVQSFTAGTAYKIHLCLHGLYLDQLLTSIGFMTLTLFRLKQLRACYCCRHRHIRRG